MGLEPTSMDINQYVTNYTTPLNYFNPIQVEWECLNGSSHLTTDLILSTIWLNLTLSNIDIGSAFYVSRTTCYHPNIPIPFPLTQWTFFNIKDPQGLVAYIVMLLSVFSSVVMNHLLGRSRTNLSGRSPSLLSSLSHVVRTGFEPVRFEKTDFIRFLGMVNIFNVMSHGPINQITHYTSTIPPPDYFFNYKSPLYKT